MENTFKGFAISGAVFCALAVVLGAFAAHGLKSTLSEAALLTFKTGVQYQYYHGLGLLVVAALQSRLAPALSRCTLWLFSAGVVLFSGSLYLLAALEWSWLGPITPLGGLCFIGGWSCLIAAIVKGQGDA